MISFKTVTAICLGATLCTAQTINISGTVKNTDGVGISGATVKLEVADISATTGSDGSFILSNGPAAIQAAKSSRAMAASTRAGRLNPSGIYIRTVSGAGHNGRVEKIELIR